MASFTISLNNLYFFANHGVHAEEALVGNEFVVNLSLDIKAPKEKVFNIQDTINYAEVYRITKEIFAQREPLLETIAMSIAEALHEAFPAIKMLSIQIAKLHPPIPGFTGSVSVTYKKQYKA